MNSLLFSIVLAFVFFAPSIVLSSDQLPGSSVLSEKALDGIRALQGVNQPKDVNKGIALLEKAAEQGDIEAAKILLRSYSNKKSKFYDPVKAEAYLRLVSRGSIKSSEQITGWQSNVRTNFEPHAIGSGFAVNKAGVFVTNHHVIDQCKQIIITYRDKHAVGTVAAASGRSDLAVVKVNARTDSYLSLRSYPARMGEPVRVAGFPNGILKYSEGVVASIVKGEDFKILQISASVSSGNSCGPVVDAAGMIIGVAVAKLAAGEAGSGVLGDDYNFAVSVEELILILKAHNIGFDSNKRTGKLLDSEFVAELLKRASAQIACLR